MRDLVHLFGTIGLLMVGVFLLALGLAQVRERRPNPRRWLVYAGAGDLLIGAGLSAGSAYHLSTLISE